MTFEKTNLEGVYIVHFQPKIDERGYFMRTFCQKEFKDAGIAFSPVQINRSLTKKRGTIRGMHFQTAPKREAKLIQCIRGSIYDVALDVRPRSKTFGQWVGIELTDGNHTAFYLPKGIAHGFQTKQTNCEVEYFMSQYYAPGHASGVRATDSRFNIRWPLPVRYGSKKDATWPLIAAQK